MTNDLTVNNNNIINLVSGKNATLTSATAVGGTILNVSTMKCLKTAGNLSMTSDATSITLTGSSTIPTLTTGKIIASTGTRENGATQTGIVFMNTVGEEILYCNNTRNVNLWVIQ